MSAIIAGSKCRKCKHEYYTSFGRPKWFDKGVRSEADPTTKGPNPDGKYYAFKRIAGSGYCLPCIAMNQAGEELKADLEKLMKLKGGK